MASGEGYNSLVFFPCEFSEKTRKYFLHVNFLKNKYTVFRKNILDFVDLFTFKLIITKKYIIHVKNRRGLRKYNK